MRGAGALLLLCLCIVSSSLARAAVLRAIYLDQNGRDVKLEVLVDRWWAEAADESVDVPAGTKIKQRSSATALTDSNYTVPVNLAVRIANPTLESTARLGKSRWRRRRRRRCLAPATALAGGSACRTAQQRRPAWMPTCSGCLCMQARCVH